MGSSSTQPNAIPPVEPVDLAPNNTMTTDAGSTNGLQDTLGTSI